MRRSKIQPLKAVLQEYIRHFDKDGKLKQIQIINAWYRILGKTVATSTGTIYVKDKILYVQLNSSVIKSELFMLRQNLVAALNAEVGENVIDSINFR